MITRTKVIGHFSGYWSPTMGAGQKRRCEMNYSARLHYRWRQLVSTSRLARIHSTTATISQSTCRKWWGAVGSAKISELEVAIGFVPVGGASAEELAELVAARRHQLGRRLPRSGSHKPILQHGRFTPRSLRTALPAPMFYWPFG